MTEQNLLSGATEIPETDPNKNYLAELVGEGKKFRTVDELAKGKYDADNYVKILEKNMDQLRQDFIKEREENATKARLEDIVRQLETSRNAQVPSEPTGNTADNSKQPTFNPEELNSLVSNKIQEFEFNKKQNENFNLVANKLREHFGDNYPNVLKDQARVLGLSDEDVNSLARKSPAAFFRTMGLDQPASKENFMAPPKGDQRSAFKPSTSQKRTWSYWKAEKAKNPNIFLDPSTNIKMHNDLMELGDEAFFDVD